MNTTRLTFLTPFQTKSMLALFLTVVVSLSGVYATDSSSGAAGGKRTVTDALDRTVQVPADPQRIVTAGRAVLMIADVLYAFESAPDRIVGIGRISQGKGSFPAVLDSRYDEKIVFERNVGPEQVAAAQPDLVILKTFMRQNLGRTLEQLSIPVLYVELETPEQYERDIRLLGTVLSETDRAEEIIASFQTLRERIEDRTTSLSAEETPSTLLLYPRASGGDISFQVPPANWIQTRLVESAGGDPVWVDTVTGGGWQTVGFEQVALWDPDIIVLISYNQDPKEVRNNLLSHPRWSALSAVQSDRFYAFPGDFYSWDQPDTRWILGLQWMATRLHPDRFSDISMERAVERFFADLYGMNRQEITEHILPRLTGDLD